MQAQPLGLSAFAGAGAAEQYQILSEALLSDPTAATVLTPAEQVHVAFSVADCRFNLGDYPAALKLYDDLAERYNANSEGTLARVDNSGTLQWERTAYGYYYSLAVTLGGVTSWQHVPDPLNPDQPVFSRDLLQVEILNADRSDRVLTVFNNHLKSHYVPFTEDPEVEGKRANELRKRQCEAVATIIETETRPDSSYVVVGDMNDPPDSEFLTPLASSTALKLKFGLENVQETQPGPGNPPPPSPGWTERFKPTGNRRSAAMAATTTRPGSRSTSDARHRLALWSSSCHCDAIATSSSSRRDRRSRPSAPRPARSRTRCSSSR